VRSAVSGVNGMNHMVHTNGMKRIERICFKLKNTLVRYGHLGPHGDAVGNRFTMNEPRGPLPTKRMSTR